MLPLLTIETFGMEMFGELYGLISFGFFVPSLVAPICAGASFDKWASYKPAFGLSILIFASAIAALLAGRKRQQPRRAHK